MLLPNHDRAEIDVVKLRDYLLSPDHPTGRAKEAFFRSLGYTRERHFELESALRQLVKMADADLEAVGEHGWKYRVVGWLEGPAGRACVVTIWIVRSGEDQPRFVTAFPGGRR